MTLARELADTAGRPQVDKNLLINGGMQIWQRSTSTSVSTDTYSTVDRWKTRVESIGAFTISRSTDVPSAQGFGYSTKWDCTTADTSPGGPDFLLFEQRIEGQNLQHLLKGTSSAKALTLSFWVKSNKTGTYITRLYDYDNTRHICKAYTIDSASTWEKKTITFEGDTTGTLNNDNQLSLIVDFFLAAGASWTAGTLDTSWAVPVGLENTAVGQVNLADSTSNEFYITGCQLEVGEAATDFQFEPYETVLRKCLRYFEINTNDQYFAPRARTSYTSACFSTVFLKQKMRAAPTVFDVPTLNLSGHTVVRLSESFFMGEATATSSGGTSRYTGWKATAEL